jgi:predicted dehydrogenase
VGRYRVGLIGLGAVAQVIHLPVLAELRDRFEVVAGCDVAEEFARTVCDRYGVPSAYGSAKAMLAAERLDAVAVLNTDEFHCEATVAALEAGCHVLLEKPASLVPREVEQMIKARDASGRMVMVGYMRRHAAAYTELRERLRNADRIQHVSMRDIIGPNDYFIRQVAQVLTPTARPAHVSAETARRTADLVEEVLGVATPDTVRAFRLLCGLSSHDLSAMRGLIGSPQGVVAARSKQNGRFVSVMFDYGEFIATYEVGMDRTGVFDAYIEVFADDRRYRIDYDTPYIRHLPTVLGVTETTGDSTKCERTRPSFRDPYTNQWLRFAACLAGEDKPTETLEDAMEDVRLAIEIASLVNRT